MAAVIEATRKARSGSVGTGDAYDGYKALCERVSLRPLSGRAFSDLLTELDMYSVVRSRVLSKGRYGRTREVLVDLPQELVDRIYSAILLNLGARR
jgi:cell division control protein 6